MMADEDDRLDFDEAKSTAFVPSFLLTANLESSENLHASTKGRRQQTKRLKAAAADAENDSKKIYSERLRRFDAGNDAEDAEDGVTLRHKLPVKLRDGKWHQVIEKKRAEKSTAAANSDEKVEKSGVMHATPNIFTSPIRNVDWRRALAVKCTSVMAEPQSTRCMEELRHLQTSLEEILHMQNSNFNKIFEVDEKIDLILASLGELYKDIIPGYRIRSDEEENEEKVAEKGGKQLKKDTKKLQEVEFSLLSNYSEYLRLLESQFQPLTVKKGSTGSVKHAMLAVQCMSSILLAHPHFNYRQNIINLIIELCVVKYAADRPLAHAINAVAARTLRDLFRKDVLGDVVLEAVSYMSKLARNSNAKKLTPILIETMLSITIDEDHRQVLEEESKKNHDEKLSLKEKKRRKRIAVAERDLRATKAENSKKLRARFQSQILTQMFAVYFRVLKAVTGAGSNNKKIDVLLAPVLRGVAKFGLMINIEFYDNLFQLLDSIMKASASTMEPQHKMWCVLAVFRLLSGRGSSLQIDPQRFYQHMLDACDKLSQNLSGIKKTGKNYKTDTVSNGEADENYDEADAVPNAKAGQNYDAAYVSQCIVALVQCTRYAYISRRKSVAFEQVLKLCGRLLTLARVMNQVSIGSGNVAGTNYEQFCIAVMLNVRELTISFPRLAELLLMRDESRDRNDAGSAGVEEEFEVLETATPCFTVGIYNTIPAGSRKKVLNVGAVADVLKTLRFLANSGATKGKSESGSVVVKKLALFLSNPDAYRHHLPPQLRSITAAEWLRKAVKTDIVKESLLAQIK